MTEPSAKRQRIEVKPPAFSLLLLQPQPSDGVTTFKLVTLKNWANATTWRDAARQLYDVRLYKLRTDFTTRIDAHGDTLVQFHGTPTQFDRFITQTVVFTKPIPDGDKATIYSTFQPMSPPLYAEHKVAGLTDAEFTDLTEEVRATTLRVGAAVKPVVSAAPARGVQLVPRTGTPTFEPPFPSTTTIPDRFLFLIHASPTDPRTWTRRVVKTEDIDAGNRKLGLAEYPGAYFSLVTRDNVDEFTPYNCGQGCYVGIFALDLLKQRNWHMNLQDVHGQIGSTHTLFPWQLDEIELWMQRSTGFNEVVFHDAVPLDPFMVDAFKVTAKTGMRQGSSSDFRVQAHRVGRVELQALDSRASLNSALPLYCWPSMFELSDEDEAFESDLRWKEAMASACGLNWSSTLEANQGWMAAADAVTEKRAFRGPLLAQAQRVNQNRGMQSLESLYQLSLEPTRIQRELDGGFFGASTVR